jgi:hypothetical protein
VKLRAPAAAPVAQLPLGWPVVEAHRLPLVSRCNLPAKQRPLG